MFTHKKKKTNGKHFVDYLSLSNFNIVFVALYLKNKILCNVNNNSIYIIK